MDIRFSNRWNGLSYTELYYILDGLTEIGKFGTNNKYKPLVFKLIHEINHELIERHKMGGTLDELGGQGEGKANS
mgnify:CR=1 FL=1